MLSFIIPGYSGKQVSWATRSSIVLHLDKNNTKEFIESIYSCVSRHPTERPETMIQIQYQYNNLINANDMNGIVRHIV